MIDNEAAKAAVRPGPVQGVLLVSLGILAVMAIILLAPSMPRMQAHFAANPDAAQLVTFALTCPALCVALLSPFAGMVVDRFGRRRPLIASLLLYVLMGTAPLYLNSLKLIIISRLGVGVAETVLLAASMTLLGDYFEGKTRERYLALSTGITSIAATLFFALGGVLGDISWRAPFCAYLLAPLMLLAVLKWTWEPETHKQAQLNSQEHVVPIPWIPLGALCGVTMAGGMVFILPQILIGVIMGAHGFTAPSTAGLVGAVGSVAMPLGALCFTLARQRGVPVPVLVTLAFLLGGAGLYELAWQSSVPWLGAAMFLHEFGGGFMLSGLMAWMLGLLHQEIRGKGTGAYFASFFIAQPVCGMLFGWLAKSVTGQPLATVELFGGFAMAMALVLLLRLALGLLLQPRLMSR